MNIYSYEEVFGLRDITTEPMRRAIGLWQALYYGKTSDSLQDSCQRIGYTIVNKLVKTIFGEYHASCSQPGMADILRQLDRIRKETMQQVLTGGECYLKPCIDRDHFFFSVIPRTNILIFNRDMEGNPTDLGMVETSLLGKYYYTLLERRHLDPEGFLTIENRLFRSLNAYKSGTQVSLREHPAYQKLEAQYRFQKPLGSAGLIRLKAPILNCVDGSPDGVSVYAAAAGLIANIDRNEAQMNEEFDRGESRIITSADLLRDGTFSDHLFVGMDDDPEQVGMTIFSPQLRESSFLARKQEYLRNVESLIGLRRGMLCDAGEDQRTATEIASSAGDFNLTVMEFQTVWEEGLRSAVQLCRILAELYHLPAVAQAQIDVDWGNGILYDEEKIWQDYRNMVKDGLIRPEIALGWRFNMPRENARQEAAIREKLMPQQTVQK